MNKILTLVTAVSASLALALPASAGQLSNEQKQLAVDMANSSAHCLAAHAYIHDKDERQALAQIVAHMPDEQISRESSAFLTVLGYGLGEASMGLHAVEQESGKQQALALAETVYQNNQCNIDEVLKSVG